jgi:hypothetical protein
MSDVAPDEGQPGVVVRRDVGLPEPAHVYGIEQLPMEGVSMAYTFDDATARDRTRRSTSS